MGGPPLCSTPLHPITDYWPSWGAPFLAVPGCSPLHLLFQRPRSNWGYLALLWGLEPGTKGCSVAGTQLASMHACSAQTGPRSQLCLYLARVGPLWGRVRGERLPSFLAAPPKEGLLLLAMQVWGIHPWRWLQRSLNSPGLLGSGVWVSGSQAAAAIVVGRN